MGLLELLYRKQHSFRQWMTAQKYRLVRAVERNGSTPVDLHVSDPQKVLLVLTGLIGDSVMATPVIAEARNLWPRAEITLLGNPNSVALLEACPELDVLQVADVDAFSLRRRNRIAQLKQWLAVCRFDIALIILGDQFAALLAAAGIPVRVGVRGSLLESCLTHRYEIESASTWGPSERLNALRCLGFQIPETPPRLWVSQLARISSEQKLAERGWKPGESYFVIHPFGSTKRKWWKLDSVAELGRHVAESTGMRCLLVGGPETTRVAVPMRDDNLVDLRGGVSLSELVAVIDKATLVISTDSGPFHIAGALGRPVVGLFSHRRPEHANRYPQGRVVYGMDQACERRCSWDRCYWAPCRQMLRISAEMVADQVAKKLRAESVGVR